MGHTDPGPGCHGEAGTSRSCWGAFPRSTVSSVALERAKSIPSAQAREVSFAVFAWEPESMPGSALAPSAGSLSARQVAIRSDPGSNNETQSLALSRVSPAT